MITRATLLAVLIAAAAAPSQSVPGRFPSDGPLKLVATRHQGSGETVFAGQLEVAENPFKSRSRRIAIQVVVLPARSEHPRADPIVYLAGGPGQAATTTIGRFVNDPLREDRDFVFVDQRGTGRSNPLHVDVAGSPADPAGYLAPLFDRANFRAARDKLAKKADLRCYTTPIAMDDLDAVREALGYQQINLIGGSYGTRAALVYMRQHADRVRTAVLDGVAPIAFENPLHHARSSQDGFERLVEECEGDPKLHAAYPDLRGDLKRVLARFEHGPIEVELGGREGEKPFKVPLTRDEFASGLRVLLYYEHGNRRVPLLLQRAAAGDLVPFAETALASNRALRDTLAFGMLMCVTAAEDLARITEDEIVRECADTFTGENRVRAQLAIAAIWPKGYVPKDYAEPVAVDVPTLVLSGSHDPVTPPRWGEEAVSHLPNGKHIVVHGCHGVAMVPRVARLVREFLDEASVADLDLEGLDQIRMSGIVLPDGSRANGR